MEFNHILLPTEGIYTFTLDYEVTRELRTGGTNVIDNSPYWLKIANAIVP